MLLLQVAADSLPIYIALVFNKHIFLVGFIFFLLICLKSFMADLDRSSGDISVNSREESSQDSKLEFSEDEETLITRMFSLVGERWSLIAGRIPGRTAEEIEKYWTSRYSTTIKCKTQTEFGLFQFRA